MLNTYAPCFSPNPRPCNSLVLFALLAHFLRLSPPLSPFLLPPLRLCPFLPVSLLLSSPTAAAGGLLFSAPIAAKTAGKSSSIAAAAAAASSSGGPASGYKQNQKEKTMMLTICAAIGVNTELTLQRLICVSSLCRNKRESYRKKERRQQKVAEKARKDRPFEKMRGKYEVYMRCESPTSTSTPRHYCHIIAGVK